MNCKHCGKAPAKKYYCPTCAVIIRNKNKRANARKNNPLGFLIVAGVKAAPSLVIIDDPLPFGGFYPGTRFTGKFEITSMLATFAFTDNTIVEAGGKRLRIVNNKFCPIDIE